MLENTLPDNSLSDFCSSMKRDLLYNNVTVSSLWEFMLVLLICWRLDLLMHRYTREPTWHSFFSYALWEKVAALLAGWDERRVQLAFCVPEEALSC